MCSGLNVIMALKAEEINLLVYRYLQESGHLHSAFTFAYESLVTQSEIAKMYADTMPPGALISIIQKGLMYLKVEENLDADISKCSTDPTCCIESSKELSILSATVLQGITKSKSIKYSKMPPLRRSRNLGQNRRRCPLGCTELVGRFVRL